MYASAVMNKESLNLETVCENVFDYIKLVFKPNKEYEDLDSESVYTRALRDWLYELSLINRDLIKDSFYVEMLYQIIRQNKPYFQKNKNQLVELLKSIPEVSKEDSRNTGAKIKDKEILSFLIDCECWAYYRYDINVIDKENLLDKFLSQIIYFCNNQIDIIDDKYLEEELINNADNFSTKSLNSILSVLDYIGKRGRINKSKHKSGVSISCTSYIVISLPKAITKLKNVLKLRKE